MNVAAHLDHISHCKTASGTNWSNKWTYRVSIMNTRRDLSVTVLAKGGVFCWILLHGPLLEGAGGC
jgi:hypothetical protein